MYVPALREEVSQGDVFDALVYRYVYQESAESEPKILERRIRAMLLSYDCEYDKLDAANVYMGEVRAMAEFDSSTVGNVRKYKVFNVFPLAVAPGLLEETYVDFRRIYRFAKTDIAQASTSRHRLVSLTDVARLALQQQMSLFFGFQR
jgi:hypothetical protein